MMWRKMTNMHLTLLEIAKQDLKASKCLLSKKLYPQSIFYLEQSIEKAVKSLGIWSGNVTEEEIKDRIRHKTPKVFTFILKRGIEKVKKTLKEFEEKFPEIKETSLWKKLQNQAKSMEKDIKNIQDKWPPIEEKGKDLSFSKEKLGEIINHINSSKISGWILGLEGIKTVKELYQVLKKDVGKVAPLTKSDIEKLKKSYELTLKVLFCTKALFYLSAILSPHVSSSRYPEKMHNPLKVYTKEMPLVQKLKPLMKIAEKNLEYLSDIYRNMPSIEVFFPNDS